MKSIGRTRENPQEKHYSQLSVKQKRAYHRTGLKYQDPIWMLMKNPLFTGKINTLLCQSREKWESLEREKLLNNPFYKPVPCPLSLPALTWVSAYLKYYFLTINPNGPDAAQSVVSDPGIDALLNVFTHLVSHNSRPVRQAEREEIPEDLLYFI